MNVRELISILENQDPEKEVKIPSPTGGYMPVSDVSAEIERDPYDSDWDRTVLVII